MIQTNTRLYYPKSFDDVQSSQIHFGPYESTLMSTKILQISDLHFGPPFVAAIAEALLRAIPSLAPDAIVASGDLTQRAKRYQFEEARQFFDRLPDIPLLVIPGNHDVPLYRIFERLFRPHALYREIISPDLNPVLRVGNVVMIGLDSTAPRRSISNGRLDLHQLRHCAETFASVPDEIVRIVVAHHQFAPGHDRVFDVSMPGARRAIDCFVEQKVEMILGGHLHRSYIGSSLDFFPGHHRDRGVIIVQCGTTTSSRGKGREHDENTFNLIEADLQNLAVTHYLYFEETGEFAPISRHLFPRQGHRLDLGDQTPSSQ
ncbi:MAG: metallophosphoesterase [Arenicellales bacterium]